MNDERPIEKLLRRYAKKRRDESGPPPELHPATRRLLQGEVARRHHPVRPAQGGGFWALLQARWIYAAACVVVGVGAVFSLRDEQGASPLASGEAEMALAKATSASEEKLQDDALKKLPADKMELAVNSPAPVPTSAASRDGIATLATPRAERAPQLSFADGTMRRFGETSAAEGSSLAPTADQYKSAREISAITPTPAEADPISKTQPEQPASFASSGVAGRQPTATGALGVSDAGKDVAVTESRPAARAPSRAATTTVRSRNATPARSGELERADPATVSQSFANLALAAPAEPKQKATPPAPVLANFRIEQSGDQVRVIDGDGSTYFGLAPGVAADAATDASKGAAAFSQAGRSQPVAYDRLAGETQTAGGYLYRVEGTNRTLQQAVSFAWNFVATTNTAAVPVPSAGPAPGSPTTPWLNSAINGQVRINTGAQFELNAAPVK
jgi:hypothetical protein